MTIQHFSAGEYIQAQSERIERLMAEAQELRQQNATLAAINLKLRSTDLSAADIAESLRTFWQHKGETVAFETLIHAADMRCAGDMEAAQASLWVHIRRLRMKLEKHSALRVLTVRTIGYLLQEGKRDQGELSR